jgi:hypothetical protein
VHPGHSDSRGRREVLEPTGRCVPLHPGAAAVAEDRTAGPFVGSPVKRPPARRLAAAGEDDFAALTADAQQAVAVLFAEVGDVR